MMPVSVAIYLSEMPSGTFFCLAGYRPIWNSFWESGHFLSQLPPSSSEEVAAIGHNEPNWPVNMAEICLGLSKRVL